MSPRVGRSGLFAVALALASAAPAAAQDAPSDCDLLTTEEVAATLGSGSPTMTEDAFFCTWIAGSSVVQAGVAEGLGLDVQRESWPDGVDLTVAGHDAWFSPASNQLWVDVDGQELYIAGFAATDDVQGLLTSLAELAVPRVPTGAGAAAGSLVSLFPSEVGGTPLIVQEIPAEQVAMLLGADPGVLEQLEAALAGMGKTMADLEVAFGIGQAGQLIAYRIAGEDASVFVDRLAEAFLGSAQGAETSVQQIAGKDVTVASMGGQPIIYLYSSGDIVWAVVAAEPGLSEFIAALP